MFLLFLFCIISFFDHKNGLFCLILFLYFQLHLPMPPPLSHPPNTLISIINCFRIFSPPSSTYFSHPWLISILEKLVSVSVFQTRKLMFSLHLCLFVNVRKKNQERPLIVLLQSNIISYGNKMFYGCWISTTLHLIFSSLFITWKHKTNNIKLVIQNFCFIFPYEQTKKWRIQNYLSNNTLKGQMQIYTLLPFYLLRCYIPPLGNMS